MDALLVRNDAAARDAIGLVNARIVLSDKVVSGEVAIAGGEIAAIRPPGAAELDCEGDYLVPGLVDLHTDNIEHHFHPRPGVRWPSAIAAVLAHDWQMLGSGITTVLDSLSIGDYDTAGARTAMLNAAIGGIDAARAAGLLKAGHYFHFRCELSDPGLLPVIRAHVDNPNLRLLSLMDHTPGQRQWHDIELYRAFRRKKNNQVWTDSEFAIYLAERRTHQARLVPEARSYIVAAARDRDIRLASHDDTSRADVEQAAADGISISEFPTTLAAASRARELGQHVVMGSPNVVLGGSHSGNVGALELAEAGLLDVLTSDYVPASLLQAAFLLAEVSGDLPRAIAAVSAVPAAIAGLDDRGRIAPGLRADLLRVRLVDGLPVIQGIWVGGRRYL
ncbi:MAG: alpha-D-ribose 1-methylphosphonate 5-triphosphate diphosphatase [Devosia sp.]|nr:alpha-D-ribose 1-methylphosphonate 5-triphosphate diphosphatase [Devosia sp.]